jgi:hypothetical protein
MQAMYHMHPPQMVGEVLYPLNTLRQLHPGIYTREIAKYQDHPSRFNLPRLHIPKLNCLWNDVVQCSPIHPHLLYLALRERGLLPAQHSRTFFQIPVSSLGDTPLAIVSSSGDPTIPLREEEVQLIDHTTYRELDIVPAQALEWYDHLARQKKLFGLFMGVPHVMVQGPIVIHQAREILWEEPPTS